MVSPAVNLPVNVKISAVGNRKAVRLGVIVQEYVKWSIA